VPGQRVPDNRTLAADREIVLTAGRLPWGKGIAVDADQFREGRASLVITSRGNAHPSMFAGRKNGSTPFPQPLTSFTLDALGVFYLSLSLSVLFMIGQRGMATLVTYLRGAIGLVIIIVIATLLNIGVFHFSAHPRHIVYLATYVVVMVGTVVIPWWDRRETTRAA
jgi:hypothetical protein